MELTRHMTGEQRGNIDNDPYIAKIYKNSGQGAATSVWAALAADLEGKWGKYLEIRQIVGPWDPSDNYFGLGYGSHAYDTEETTKLWARSMEWVSLS